MNEGDYLQSLLFSGALALVINWVAWNKNFFSLPSRGHVKEDMPSLSNLAWVFGIYLGMALIVSPVLSYLVLHFKKQPPTSNTSSTFQFFILLATLLSLFFYCSKIKRPILNKILKDTSRPHKTSLASDFGMGIAAWAISFPVVMFIGQLADFLLLVLFNVQNYEQAAVRYFKTTLGSPSAVVLALFAILIFAPVIEELLFRGFLQNWFKRFLGTKAAILLSSLCFALFHLAPSQGIGNIALFISLFSLACYLGFIYERQGSLIASIAMHMTFNAVSSLRILFGSEG